MKRVVFILLVITMIFGTTSALFANGQQEDDGKQKLAVGIVLPTKDEPRWLQDEARFKDLLDKAGYSVEILFSQGDPIKERANVEALIAKGIEVLIITPQDGAAAAAAADLAHNAGVKVISHDRLITNTENVDYYVTFNSVDVGRAWGNFLIEKAAGRTGLNLYYYAGGAFDNNAFLFFQGSWEVLQPKIADGTFIVRNSSAVNELMNKNVLTREEQAKIIGQIGTEWQASYAKNLAESNLTAAPSEAKGEVFIVAPNDPTSRAIGDAFAADPEVTMYWSTGQDVEKASIQYIIDGKQGMTVWKDVRDITAGSIDAAVAYLEERTPSVEAEYDNKAAMIPASNIPVITLSQENLDLLFDSGYYEKSEFNF